ncbi:MFS transporter [Saliterribacillus persicus]|uniref:NNP family nitrate/nitrite transporter-like MFS transporter n=1 Tax=Saliterribacillus persicus TaxID=930114 RepID=A0A368XHE1_9BACI|nr:nitrate/nitrite transporter [Saliterribacillus persicus]RCW67019.1 NNP family nitrate/nitrite transporter-like MFS transporter [Saliterribacillus persicus]
MNKNKLQLPLQTSSLIVGFMVWVIISSLMPYIKEDIPLSSVQLSWVTAVPVILGSIMRIPIGYWTNRFGARWIFLLSLLFLILPVYYLSLANSFFDLIISGLLIGVGGAIFSVGVTSLPKYYSKDRHGFVNGIYGIGNIGTALTSFGAPIIASQFGWELTVKFFLIPLLGFALLNFFLGDKNEAKVTTSLKVQVESVYRNEKVWFLSIFYFITFGSFVAFTVYLPNFLVTQFNLTEVDAGLRTAGFIAICTFIRPLGGWLGDKFNPFKILMLVFAGLTFSGVLLSFSPSITLYTVGTLTVAACSGIGNGTIFKLVPLYFSKQGGIVNGIVSAIGGLGGFFPPLILTTVYSLTGHYAIGFMALSQFALASLIIVIWMFYSDRLSLANEIMKNTGQGVMVTNNEGEIIKVNEAFSKVTGYESDEVIGITPQILSSGIHGAEFYEQMWKELDSNNYWQGEVWNKRKNGQIYSEWLTISAVKDDTGEVTKYVGIFSDLSKGKK